MTIKSITKIYMKFYQVEFDIVKCTFSMRSIIKYTNYNSILEFSAFDAIILSSKYIINKILIYNTLRFSHLRENKKD